MLLKRGLAGEGFVLADDGAKSQDFRAISHKIDGESETDSG
jgi:hypothetical protein